jgi:hypothetical protein
MEQRGANLGIDQFYFSGRPGAITDWLVVLEELTEVRGLRYGRMMGPRTSLIFVVVSVKRGSILYFPPALRTIASSAMMVLVRMSRDN